MTPDVIISAATPGEVLGLRKQMVHTRSLVVGGRDVVSGYLCGARVGLLVTGPGQANTVQALTAAIEMHRPGLIVQTGCAGAFSSSGLAIGDIGIATEEIDAHLGIEPAAPGAPLEELPFPVSVYADRAIKNRYPLDAGLAHGAAGIIKRNLTIDGLNIVTGPFITVSTITATDQGAQRYHRQYGPCMESMEGAGACHVALHYRIPFLEIRAASNLVGRRDRVAWDLPLAFDRCCRAVTTLFAGDILKWIDT